MWMEVQLRIYGLMVTIVILLIGRAIIHETYISK